MSLWSRIKGFFRGDQPHYEVRNLPMEELEKMTDQDLVDWFFKELEDE